MLSHPDRFLPPSLSKADAATTFAQDNASLHAGELKIKGAEAVAVPEGTDWLLSSPREGEDYLMSTAPSKKSINANYQTYDLAGQQNDAGVLDEMFGDLDIGLDDVPGMRAAGPKLGGVPPMQPGLLTCKQRASVLEAPETSVLDHSTG